jgi:hypothetical protein
MIELENKETRVLAAARRGLSSTEADRARVRLGVASALAKGELPDEESPELEAPRSATLFKAALGVGVAVLAGAAGYAAGHQVGFAEGARARATTVAQAAPSAPSQREVAQRSDAAREDAALGPATPLVAAAPASPPVAARRAIPSANAAASAITAMGESDLDEELRTLRRVERAQRAGNPRLALALLDELDRDQPRGKLLEERAAARAVAECQSSFGEARSVIAERFSKRYGSSVYLTRVKVACAETERGPAGDSSAERESTR